MSKNLKVYIIHSEYVQHGMTFNSKDRYCLDEEKANQIYADVLRQMIEDNQDMFDDKENYEVRKSNRKNNRWLNCYYKCQPGLSNFYVDLHTENLE